MIKRYLALLLASAIFVSQSLFSEIMFSSKGRVGIAFLIVAFILGFLGFLTAQKTKATLAEMRGQETLTILNSNVETLEYWIKNYQNGNRRKMD